MVWLVPVALVGLFVLRGVGDFMQTYCPGFVGRHIVKTLRGQIFERYVHLPVSYFDTNTSGVLLSKLTYNTEQVATATTEGCCCPSSRTTRSRWPPRPPIRSPCSSATP